jgi:hypothetical protein
LIGVLVARELLFASRIASAFERAGSSFTRVDSPANLPPSQSVDLVLVDWTGRAAGWADELLAWRGAAPGSARPRIVLFGPHTDLAAHAAARTAGLGPMWARSKLLVELDQLIQLALAKDLRLTD